MSESSTIRVAPLQKVLQRFNSELGQYINAEERFKLGRVLTIIDAAIADPEQRKAIKNLVQNEWWGGNGMRPSETPMINPHTDLSAICKVFGFDLYEENTLPATTPGTGEEFAVQRYRKIAAEE